MQLHMFNLLVSDNIKYVTIRVESLLVIDFILHQLAGKNGFFNKVVFKKIHFVWLIDISKK